MSAANKMYNLTKTCKSQIKALGEQHFVDCTFSASFFVKGRKSPNGIHNAPVESFSNLVRSYEKTEQPDRIKIEIFGNREGDDQKLELMTKTFDLGEHDQRMPNNKPIQQPEQGNNMFAGLGEAEVMAMVQKKVNEIDQLREMEILRSDNETLKREREDFKQQNLELEARINAQSTIETYASIAGKAAPILSAIFGAHPLISTAASLLSGISKDPASPLQVSAEDESKNTMIGMLDDFLAGLNEQDLSQVFAIMSKMEQDHTLIHKIAQHLNKPINA